VSVCVVLWLNSGVIRSVFTRFVTGIAVLALPALAAAQTPSPFPRPGQTRPPAQPSPPQPVQPVPTTVLPAAPADNGEAPDLGVPIYPGAQFIASYDAGRGQRYYLYGAESDFLQVVGWYKTMLKQKGDPVFEEPPVHMFDIGRYREETMAFTPSVTVKDYTWAGSLGYINPKRSGTPARFKTIIQIVPNAPGAPK
jgi:hypothetical protein